VIATRSPPEDELRLAGRKRVEAYDVHGVERELGFFLREREVRAEGVSRVDDDEVIDGFPDPPREGRPTPEPSHVLDDAPAGAHLAEKIARENDRELVRSRGRFFLRALRSASGSERDAQDRSADGHAFPPPCHDSHHRPTFPQSGISFVSAQVSNSTNVARRSSAAQVQISCALSTRGRMLRRA
jgi:hypothetical protein